VPVSRVDPVVLESHAVAPRASYVQASWLLGQCAPASQQQDANHHLAHQLGEVVVSGLLAVQESQELLPRLHCMEQRRELQHQSLTRNLRFAVSVTPNQPHLALMQCCTCAEMVCLLALVKQTVETSAAATLVQQD